MHHVETFVQLLFHLSGVDDALSDFGLVERRFDSLLNILSESCLHKVRNFFAKDTMTVSNCEKVSPSVLTKVRQHQVRILIHFIRVLRTEACLGSERKFRDAVIELFLC